MAPFLKSIRELMRKNRLLLPGGVIIAVLLLALVTRAGYGYHLTLQELLDVKVEGYRISSSMLADAARVERRLLAAEAEIKVLERGLLKEKKVPLGAARLLKEMEVMSAKWGITLSSSKTLPEREADVYMKIPVEFRFKTELPKLTMLLYDIQSSPFILGINVIRVKVSGRKNIGEVNVTLLLEGMMNKS